MLRFLRANLWFVVIAAVLVTASLLILDPAPPRELTLATGQPGGAYHAFGERLAARLAEQGITLHLRTTQGSTENIHLLADPEAGVPIALVQTGLPLADSAGLRALGSLFYEPLWVFTRTDLTLQNLHDLSGRRVAGGAEGSGTLPVVLRVLEVNGLLGPDEPAVEVVHLGGAEAAEALRSGRVDAACFIGAPGGALVRELLHDPAFRFHGLRRERAYQAAFPNLATLTVGEGQLDLAANVPAEDRVLLAATVSLVVNDAFHPGLTPALLEAATALLRDGGALERPGAFPAARPTDYPLLAEAAHYHKHGPPFLMRYLPFWAATIAFRVFIMLVPLLALLIPLFRLAPPLYQWRTRRRIFRWYAHLREVDLHLASGPGLEQIAGDLERLRHLEDEILKVKVPHSYADELYDLHLHIEWVIRRLERARAAASAEPRPATGP